MNKIEKNIFRKHKAFDCLVLFFILIVSNLHSQGLCDKTGVETGAFDFKNTNFTTVCALPYTLKLEDKSVGTDVKYVFDYSGETDISKLSGQTLSEFTYNKQGIYTILQYGKKNGKEMYSCSQFEVWENKKPQIDYYICDNKNIEIVVSNESDNKFDDFFVFWGDGNETIKDVKANFVRLKHQFAIVSQTQNISIYAYRKRKTILGSDAYAAGCTQILNLNINMNEGLPKPKISELKANNDNSIDLKIEHSKQTASYQIIEQLPSGDILVGTTNTKTIKLNNIDLSKPHCFKVSYEVLACNTKIISDEAICSIPIQINENFNENEINLTTNLTNINLSRNIKNESGTQNFPIGTQAYKDAIKCNTNYCYSALVEKNGFKIYTDQKCTNRSPITPSPLELCLATVKGENKIEIIIQDSKIQKEYELFKETNNGIFEKIATSSQNRFIDLDVKTSVKSYCYRVKYRDECDFFSTLTQNFCSVHISNNTNNLEWSSVEPFTSSILNYQLDKLDKLGNLVESIPLSPSQNIFLLPETEDDYRYKIIAKSVNGLIGESNLVEVNVKNTIIIPNTFTPNSDNKNDVLVIFGTNIDQFQLLIYNNWGEPVFESNSQSNSWNGGINNDLNNPAPTGLYAFAIKATFKNGDVIEKKEGVWLLK